MGWTKWRLLACGNEWYNQSFDYEGPSCYELGTGGPRGGRIQPHYIGETRNERARMGQYASHGSHLSKIIEWHLKQGWCLYYRGYKAASKKKAVEMQNRMLDRYKYDWNDKRNPDD